AMSRWIAVVVFSAALSFPNVARAEKCLTVKAGTAREIGRLRSDGREKSYCVYARAGQKMKVTVKPLAPDLVTRGYITSPVSDQNDGGPGGVIFNQRLSEEGRYEIHVGQRYEKKTGEFVLSIELK